MRLTTYQSEQGPRAAAFHRGKFYDLNRADASLPACIKAFLTLGPDALARADAALASAEPLSEPIRRLPPIPSPDKIICIGLNYADHARETGAAIPERPVVFNKFPTAAAADGDPIRLPPISPKVDLEAELVVVIGRAGRSIPVETAADHIAGYCCGNDVSARDWQIEWNGGQWLLGKTFDGFAPFGPALVTADEVPDPNRLAIQSRVNGCVMQQSNTSQLIFPVAELVAFVSQFCTLRPGDLIFTGTPSGVGVARKPPVFLKARDVVEIEIEKIGILRNPVVGPESLSSA